VLIILNIANAQTQESITTQDTIKLSRTTLSSGYALLITQDNNTHFNTAFLNVHLRANGFNEFSKIYAVSWSFEPGVNVLVPINKNTLPIPMIYVKSGPEFKVSNRVYFAISAGLNVLIWDRAGFPLPFCGINIFYLTNFLKRQFLEFETGFHTTIPFTPALLFYITLGISFH
jgi:hypothetical protein